MVILLGSNSWRKKKKKTKTTTAIKIIPFIQRYYIIIINIINTDSVKVSHSSPNTSNTYICHQPRPPSVIGPPLNFEDNIQSLATLTGA